MHWRRGRQHGGYEVLTLCSIKMPFLIKGFDCHILKYSKGHYIPLHKDENSGGSHHRINIVLKACKGGEFICKDAFRLFNRIFYFKPDEMKHRVSVCHGTRYVLSIGWIV